MNKKKSDREKVLNEINDKIEKMNLEIKISELDDRIVIISAVRDKFKGKILNLFLIKIFGEEYRNNVWEIQEEYENQKYAEINNFFDLLAKKYEEGNNVFIEEISEENFDIKENDPNKQPDIWFKSLKVTGTNLTTKQDLEIRKKEISLDLLGRTLSSNPYAPRDVKPFLISTKGFPASSRLSTA